MARTKNHINVQIGKILHVSEYCVRKTIKTWELAKDVSDMPRTGRPSKLSNRDKSGIFRMSRENRKLSYKKLAQIFNESKNNPKVSRELVRRILLYKGIGTYIAARKPILSIKDKCKRRVWSKERLNWSVEQWAKVIWNDEANFQVVNRNGRICVKRFAAEKYSDRSLQHRRQGGGGSVGIWGCFLNFFLLNKKQTYLIKILQSFKLS